MKQAHVVMEPSKTNQTR